MLKYTNLCSLKLVQLKQLELLIKDGKDVVQTDQESGLAYADLVTKFQLCKVA